MEEHRAKIKARKDAWLEQHPDQKAIHEASLKDPKASKKRREERRAKQIAKNKARAVELKRGIKRHKQLEETVKDIKVSVVKKKKKKVPQESTGSEASTSS